MDITGIIQQLRQERARIDESILALESLAAGSAPRRGRPPKWMAEVKLRGRPPTSKNKAKDGAR